MVHGEHFEALASHRTHSVEHAAGVGDELDGARRRIHKVTSLFHADRWDYVFTIRRQGAEPQQRRVVVLFDGDKLKSIDTGGELPAERDFVASIDTFKTSRNAPPLALSDEQVKALPAPKAAPAEAAPAAAAASAVAPVRTYPPLEPR